MKILITNTVVLNTGDAAILFGLLKILRQAFSEDIEFIIYDKNPDIAQKYYPELVFRKSLYFNLTKELPIKTLEKFLNFCNLKIFTFALWCRKLNLSFVSKIILSPENFQDIVNYENADLIVSTGGTYLVENYPLFTRIFDYKITLSLGKPLVFFTQSLGPFALPSNQRELKKIFEQSLLILLRDLRSEKNILDLHPTKQVNIHVTADAAFALAEASKIEAAKHQQGFSSPLKVAISVRDWQYFKNISPEEGRNNYLKAIAEATEYLVNTYKAEVTFISTCQGIPEYWKDDSQVALEITEKLAKNVIKSVSIERNFHSPTKLAEILQSFDFVISTRLHMAILSLGVGIPVMPIAYEFKTQELFKNIGQENLVMDIEDINTTNLIELITQFITSIDKIRPQMFAGVYQEYEKAKKSQLLVTEAFETLSLANN